MDQATTSEAKTHSSNAAREVSLIASGQRREAGMGGDGGAEAMQALSLLAQLAASGANVGESEWYRSAGPGTGIGGGEAGGRAGEDKKPALVAGAQGVLNFSSEQLRRPCWLLLVLACLIGSSGAWADGEPVAPPGVCLCLWRSPRLTNTYPRSHLPFRAAFLNTDKRNTPASWRALEGTFCCPHTRPSPAPAPDQGSRPPEKKTSS